MLLNKKELEVYKVKQCDELELKNIEEFYAKLIIENIMILKGMYLIFHEELRVLNLSKIHSLDQLYKKSIRYRKHLKRLEKLS